MNSKEFQALFQRGIHDHFSGSKSKPPMDSIIKQFAVSSRREGRKLWENQNQSERTAAEIMRGQAWTSL